MPYIIRVKTAHTIFGSEYITEVTMRKVEICGVDTAGLPRLTAKESDELMRALKAGDAAGRVKFVVGAMPCLLYPSTSPPQ